MTKATSQNVCRSALKCYCPRYSEKTDGHGVGFSAFLGHRGFGDYDFTLIMYVLFAKPLFNTAAEKQMEMTGQI